LAAPSQSCPVRLRACLACLAAVALLVCIAAPPARASGGQLGVSSHLIWLGESDAEAEMMRIRAGGVDWIREDFRWDLLEPARGHFNWARTDALMAAAARTGVNVLAILGYSARWASSDPSGGGDIHYPPRDPADYARFARAVVERYGAGGAVWSSRPDLSPRPIAAVELWNEPWGWWFWKPNPDPAAYARLARAGAAAVKDARPGVKTLLSGDLLLIRRDGTAGPWLDAVLDADRSLGSLIDVYSTHPYPSPRDRSPLDTTSAPPYRFDRADLTRSIAAAHGAPKPIWITEVGWSTATGVSDAVSEETQAEYLRLAVGNAFGKQRVERMFVFGWDRSNGVAGDREGNYGLQRADGSMKPAWAVLGQPIAVDAGPAPPPRVSSAAPSGTQPAGAPARSAPVVAPAGSAPAPAPTPTPAAARTGPVKGLRLLVRSHRKLARRVARSCMRKRARRRAVARQRARRRAGRHRSSRQVRHKRGRCRKARTPR
jgi:polysaccharide biosynthesis protein PslG